MITSLSLSPFLSPFHEMEEVVGGVGLTVLCSYSDSCSYSCFLRLPNRNSRNVVDKSTRPYTMGTESDDGTNGASNGAQGRGIFDVAVPGRR